MHPLTSSLHLPLRKKIIYHSLVLASALLYIGFWHSSSPSVGDRGLAFSIVPVILAGLLFGAREGLAWAVAVMAINVALVSGRNQEGFWRSLQTTQIGLLSLLFLALVTGHMRELYARAQRELKERQQAEDALRASEAALRASESKYRALFENMGEGLVLDELIYNEQGEVVDWRILDVNPAYEVIFDIPRELAIGNLATRVYGKNAVDFPPFAIYGRVAATGQPERIEDHLNIHGKSLMGTVFKVGEGRVAVLMSDVSNLRAIEAAERQERLWAEALQQTTAALNSTLNFEELLELILSNVDRVIPCDGSSILLIEDGAPRLIRPMGSEIKMVQELSNHPEFDLANVPNVRTIQQSGKPLVIPDTRSHPDWIPLPYTDWIRSYAGVPVLWQGKTIGILNLSSGTPGYFTPEISTRLLAFAHQIGLAVENARLYSDVQRLAITDSLTGLYNRRGLDELGKREVERSRRYQRSLAAILLDIDAFKMVNDTHGHGVGDQVLVTLAQLCQHCVRTVDILARYGGEEMVILLPEVDCTHAKAVAERVRATIEGHVFSTSVGPLNITVSLGVAQLQTEHQRLADLLEQADAAMYRAKNSGRNRVAV